MKALSQTQELLYNHEFPCSSQILEKKITRKTAGWVLRDTEFGNRCAATCDAMETYVADSATEFYPFLYAFSPQTPKDL